MALQWLNNYSRILLQHVQKKGLFQYFTQSGSLACRIGAKRHLLTEDVIKLQNFQQRKLAVAHQFSGAKDEYFQRFNHKLEKNQLILKDELKILMHLCQSPDDIGTVRNAIYRYHKENRNVAFGEFNFGPLFMRLCYELGLEDVAADTVTDKTLSGFFVDATTFNIATDMLFMKGCYERAFEVLRVMRDQRVTFSRDTFTLAFGICYKLNNPESYRVCLALLEEVKTRGFSISAQAYGFAVVLALRQGDIDKAQFIFDQITNHHNKISPNLKVLILAMSGAVKESLSILTSALASNSPPLVKKVEFSQEVIDELRSRSQDGPLIVQVERAVAGLQQSRQVSRWSLDELLCRTPAERIGPVRMTEERKISRRTHRPLQSPLLAE